MASVQCFGKDSVMEFAQQIKTPAWAIYVSPTLRFSKYEGVNDTESLQMLEANLEALERSNTAGTYTIKFYEPAEGNGKLRIGTKTAIESCGFNFKLMTPDERTQNVIGGQLAFGPLSAIIRDNETLKNKVGQLEQQLNNKEPEPDRWGDLLDDLLREPQKLGALINMGKALLSGQPLPPAAIGSLTHAVQTGSAIPAADEFDDYERIGAAIDTLKEKVPDLSGNLEKLAAMDAGKLNALLKMMP